jgi:ABC-type nitrate/sulfonate/bicarbonate transport system permease component
MTSTFRKQVNAIWPGLVSIAVVLIGVEILIDVFSISPIILPRPSRVFAEFAARLTTFPEHMLVTLIETLGGLALGAAMAVLLSVLVTEVAIFRRAIMPLVIAQQVLPIVIFAPIILVWFGYGLASKIVIAAMICFFPIATSLIQGLTTIPADMIDFARSLGATRARILTRIRIPFALPFFLNALKPGVTLASIGAVIGEFLGGNIGLGYLVVEALRFINLPAMFAATTVIILQGLVLYGLIEAMNRHLLRWQHLLNRRPA